MSVFMNAGLPYDIVTLRHNYGNQLFIDLNETFDFWRHLGESVTEINIEPDYLPPDWCTILYEMPQIEVFAIKTTLERITKDLLNMHKENPEREFFKNLKMIKANLFTLKEHQTNSKFFEELRPVFPNDTEYFVDTVDVIQCLSVNEILFGLENVKVKFKRFELWDIHHPIQSFIPSEHMPFQGMKLIYRQEMSPDHLKAFLVDKHPNVSDVYLESNFHQFQYPITQLTEIFFTEPFRGCCSLKFLEPMVNLRSLSLRLTREHCLFGHEKINLPKLTKFCMSTNCCQCLAAIANSFPNLIEFDDFVNVNNHLPILEMMFKNWRYLKFMNISCSSNLKNFARLTENMDEPRLELRKLRIYSAQEAQYSGEDFLKMSKFFPHLNSLKVDVNEKIDLSDVVKGILPAFKELTEITISTKTYVDKNRWVADKDTSNAVLEHLEKFGQSLRVRNRFVRFLLGFYNIFSSSSKIVSLPDMDINQAEEASRLYEHLEQLIVFRSTVEIRRSDQQKKQLEF